MAKKRAKTAAVKKNGKGPCWALSRRSGRRTRCGIYECPLDGDSPQQGKPDPQKPPFVMEASIISNQLWDSVPFQIRQR